MKIAPLRTNEDDCLDALRALEVLDSPPEAELQALVEIASLVCNTPISLISLIDVERQWFKANTGLPEVHETPRDVALCAHAVLGEDLFEVHDASHDPRFADNPLVTGATHLRFYAGMPITLQAGMPVGTLCVIDRQPKQLSDLQRTVLRQLAIAAGQALRGRAAMRHLQRERSRLMEREHALHHETAQLQSANAQLQDLTHALDEAQRLGHFGSWEWDLASGRFNSSQALRDLMRRPEGAPPPALDEVLDCFMPSTPPGPRQAWEQCLQEGTPFALEVELATEHDGSTRWIETRGAALRDAAGHIATLRGTAQDITHRKQTELALRRSQELLERVGMLAGVGGWEYDLESGTVYWSPVVCRIHGVPPGRLLTLEESMAPYVPESRAIMQAQALEAMKTGQTFDLMLSFVRSDGVLRSVRTVGSAEMRDGEPIRLCGAVQDITDQLRLSRELEDQHELLRVTLQSIGDAVITTDASGHITWINPAAERMTGWLTQEAAGRPLRQVFHIIHEETRELAPDPVATCLETGSVVGLANHSLLVARDGQERGIEDSAAPIRSHSGDVLGAVLVFHDVSEQRRLSQEMTYRASHDALTGLLNRTEFEARLQRTLDSSRHDGSEHALLFIDLDQFKLVNDACGHTVGDKLLQRVAKLLEGTVRSRDSLARLGGDEFAVLLWHCSVKQARRVAQNICDQMDEARFMHEERRFRIGASVGLVPISRRWTNTEEIKQAADAACYAAKEEGRNRVHEWFDTDAAMQARHGEVQWTSRIERALDNDEFELYAQKISALQGEHDGLHAEVLIRIRFPDGTLIAPGAFLPAAERYHLITRIDRWVMAKTIAWLQTFECLQWLDCVNINLSGQSVGDRAFHAWTYAQLTDVACARVRSKLCFEITETTAVTHMADAALFIDEVRALGVRVALDDFGAGASSFGYLKNLAVDYLKIDGQFVRDLDKDPLHTAAVRCFVDVAKVVGVRTVAEFVEHPSVMIHLTELGVDFAQGYLVHQPEPLTRLRRVPMA